MRFIEAQTRARCTQCLKDIPKGRFCYIGVTEGHTVRYCRKCRSATLKGRRSIEAVGK